MQRHGRDVVQKVHRFHVVPDCWWVEVQRASDGEDKAIPAGSNGKERPWTASRGSREKHRVPMQHMDGSLASRTFRIQFQRSGFMHPRAIALHLLPFKKSKKTHVGIGHSLLDSGIITFRSDAVEAGISWQGWLIHCGEWKLKRSSGERMKYKSRIQIHHKNAETASCGSKKYFLPRGFSLQSSQQPWYLR